MTTQQKKEVSKKWTPHKDLVISMLDKTQKQLVQDSYDQLGHLKMYASLSPCTHLNCHASSFKGQYTLRSSLKECIMGKSLFWALDADIRRRYRYRGRVYTYTVLFACERVRVVVCLWIRHRFGLKSTDKTVVHTQSLSLSIKHNVKL